MLITSNELQKAIEILKSCENETFRIIGLAIPLFNLCEEPGRLNLEIERLESTFKCSVETTSDILSILR